MIIKFETLEGFDNLRLVEKTWRGDSGELVADIELSKAIRKLYGDTDDKVMTFEISAVPMENSERFTIERSCCKQLGGMTYSHKTLGLYFICELMLLYVGPDYPEHFYIKKV